MQSAPVILTAGTPRVVFQRSFAVGNLSTELKNKEAEK
jgi:hypothetical protein